jgi:hypothetical protein
LVTELLDPDPLEPDVPELELPELSSLPLLVELDVEAWASEAS